MLNAIIKFALRQRLLVIALSVFLIGIGTWEATQSEIDVFPNLNRPRVVVITEAPGMAPEEVEALITFPMETTLNGANGVMAVRTSSGVGISVIYVEFEWGTNIYNDRQIVTERLALSQERMPPDIRPTLAPISSIMGQIYMMGMWSQENEKTRLDEVPASAVPELDAGRIPPIVRKVLDGQPRKINAGGLSATASLSIDQGAVRWVIRDDARERKCFVRTYGKSVTDGYQDRGGQIHRMTIDYRDGKGKTRYFEIQKGLVKLQQTLDAGRIPSVIADGIAGRSGALSGGATVEQRPVRWKIHDVERDRLYLVRRVPGKNRLELHKLTTNLELRTIADWVVRQRLLTIPGVSQVFTMGGGRKQYQVLIDPDALLRYGISLHQIKQAVTKSNQNRTGGYLDEQGPNEFLVRGLGRIKTVEDLEKLAVAYRNGRAILLKQVARVVEAAQVKRGDSSAFVRQKDGAFSGGPAVVLTVNKQPGADTREVTDKINAALDDLQSSLPPDVQVARAVYSQREFIDRAVFNVIEALGDGGVLVVILLFLFLLNFRTTFITLTAIPLSIAVTALIFKAMDVSINTMTLGGIAVAIGELVDDAIVGVENVFRRLRDNRHSPNPRNTLLLVFQASAEVRNPIVFGTLIVVLVFLPLFALEGMEGRLFAPLGMAYMVSILASLAVSLTLTPVLSYLLLTRNFLWQFVGPMMSVCISASIFYWVLPRFAEMLHQPWMNITGPEFDLRIPLPLTGGAFELTPRVFWTLICSPVFWILIRLTDKTVESEKDGIFLWSLKWLAGKAIGMSLTVPRTLLILAFVGVLIAGVVVSRFEKDLLPPFNEGAVQLNIILPPGTSLKTSNQIAGQVENRLRKLEFVTGFVRRTGRAELDEHAEGVSNSEIIINLDPDSEKSREEIIEEIRETTKDVPGITTTVEQPLAHLISHMLSGVKAQVAIKIYGDDLDVLRKAARDVESRIKDVPGVKDLLVEPQVVIPQLRIQVDRDKLLQYGLTPDDVNEYVETAMNGDVVSQVLLNMRTFDLLVRFDENYREDRHALKRLSVDLPDGGQIDNPDFQSRKNSKGHLVGGRVPLEAVAKIYESGGPNTINREQVRRRIVVQCNVADRGLVDVVQDIQRRLKPVQESLPSGYYIEYGGQFESQQRASKRISLLFAMAMIGVFMVLYMMFRSVNFSIQVMVALPMAFIGSVIALVYTHQTLTVAAMVGLISLGGIASRNGILLLNHYMHLVKHEGETWSKQMIVRAGQERLAPVLMTALTSGIGLLPLAMAAGEPGKEVLYPIATVIIGGLISSTLLEFIVRPALFWTFGRKAGQRLVEEARTEVLLITEEQEAEKLAEHANRG